MLGIIIFIIFIVLALMEIILISMYNVTKEIQKAYKYRDKENEEDNDYFT